jgi:hypothetical protein
MKLITVFSATLQLFTIVPTLACLVVEGTIDIELNWLDYARVVDNGLLVCSNSWGVRIDQDNHYSLGCLPGYIYAVTTDGGMAWYRNPVTAFSFTQHHSNADSTWYFDTKQFGC